MKRKRLRKKNLAKRRKRLISTKQNSPKSAERDANVTNDELLARARAEARGRAIQPDDASVPPSLSVTFREGHASPEGWIDTDPEGEHPNVREFVWKGKVFTRGADEPFASFKKRIYDALPVGDGPHLLVFVPNPKATAATDHDIQRAICRGQVYDKLPGESLARFEERVILAQPRDGEPNDFKLLLMSGAAVGERIKV
jgi:hypothetical protein